MFTLIYRFRGRIVREEGFPSRSSAQKRFDTLLREDIESVGNHRYAMRRVCECAAVLNEHGALVSERYTLNENLVPRGFKWHGFPLDYYVHNAPDEAHGYRLLCVNPGRIPL